MNGGARFGTLLLLVSLLAAGLALRLAVPGRIALWVLCGSTAAYAFLYLAKGAGLDPERRLPGPVSRLVGGPYVAVYWGVLVLRRWLRAERPEDEVAPGLLVGALPLPWHRRRLSALGLRGVVNLCYEFSRPSGTPPGVDRFDLPTLDGTAPRREGMLAAAAWVAERLATGPVLIHCALGHSRSVTVACAVLLLEGLVSSVEEALGRIRSARPGIRLSAEQRDLLETLCGAPGPGVDGWHRTR